MKGFRHPCLLAGMPADTPVLVGLSGGADSTALFTALCECGVRVVAAHVNHGIRGDEAKRDAEFCRSLCQARGVEFCLLEADVPAEAKKSGESIEEAARRIRYAFFERIMLEKDIPLLATAHNADDNAETVILNLTRGSGTRGACGIPACRTVNGGTLVRPLLNVSRAEIEEYCRENGLSYVTDSTNLCDDYTRNRIRHRVIPELKKLNPDFVTAVSRFCASAAEDCEYLDSAARRFLECGEINAEELSLLPRPVAARALLFRLREGGARPEARHINALLDAAKNGEVGGISLPGGVTASFKRKILVLNVDDRRKKREKQAELQNLQFINNHITEN